MTLIESFGMTILFFLAIVLISIVVTAAIVGLVKIGWWSLGVVAFLYVWHEIYNTIKDRK